MAILRVMRIGGVATFTDAFTASEPEDNGTGFRFRAMRSPSGVAIFRGAVAGGVVVPPPDPTGPKTYEEQLTILLALTYDAGNSNAFEEIFETSLMFTYGPSSDLEIQETLEATIAFGYGMETQVAVEDLLESTTFFDFDTRGRLRGWNDDDPLPPATWTPQPKPELF